MIAKTVRQRLIKGLYIYRYDFVSLSVLTMLIIAFMSPILLPGHIVFSDMAFGFSSRRYLEEIFGAWNERWSTATLFNVPRLLYILPLYLLSLAFGGSGPVLVKSLIMVLVLVSGYSMYLFTKRLVSVYFTKDFNFFTLFALLTGSLFYALNPWVLFRIQHIYLLCGYSLFPLVLMFFFNVFDPKFEEQLIANYSLFRAKLYKRNMLDLILLSMAFTISAAAIHYFFFGIIFLSVVGGLIVVKTMLAHRKKEFRLKRRIMKHFFVRIAAFGVFFSMHSAYWLSMYGGSILMHAQASQHNINVVDTLSLFSRKSSITNVLYFMSYWWPMFSLEKLPVTFYIGGGVLLTAMLYAVIFRAYRDPILLFFTLLAVLFIVASTGVTFSWFADIFVLLVTKTPIIGSVFRDPNKFIGLLAVNFSVLLSIGVVHFFHQLKNNLYHRFIKYGTVVLMLASLWLYLQPMHTHYINGFYKPVPVPPEYTEVQNHLTDSGDYTSKVLYVPTSDNMTQSYTGVATPVWNTNPDPSGGFDKATGDLQIYSSQKNTVFQHEGNALSINYYMNFLQELLDKGKTLKLAPLFSVFGVNEIAYHNEYKGQEVRQAFNKQMLDSQPGLEEHYQNSIFSLYSLEPSLRIPYLKAVPKKVYTPYGYSRMVSYQSLPGFSFNKEGVVFTSLDENSSLSQANQGDYIETANDLDLWLSELPGQYYLRPFDAINEANAYLKWSKSLVSNSEWLWFLASQDIKNFAFDHDFGAGIGVTFATQKLDVLPYKLKDVKGELVADFDSLLRTEKFFMPDNPQLFEVTANPKTELNDLPLLHGEMVKDDPKNIWQVAKSGLLDAKENNPYQFKLVVSGRGTNKMHVKVRFYDESMKEIGVSYVVAPTEETDFDAVQFYGEYVSPARAKYMRMDLLAFQRPEQKNYWWVHDIQILDLEKYKKPNDFVMTKTFDKPVEASVYIRPFYSPKGGQLKITLPDGEELLRTVDDSISQFRWIDLGVHAFQAGDNPIRVENVEGFNAVNLLAVVPEEEMAELKAPVDRAIARSRVFFTLEAENDLSYTGNIQTDRVYPKLSLGRGISSQSGTLSRRVGIVKNGVYSFNFRLSGVPQYGGELKVHIANPATGYAYDHVIRMDELQQLPAAAPSIMVDTVPERDYFPQEYRQAADYYDQLQDVHLNGLPLVKGEYDITVEFNSKVPSVSTFDDLHQFNPSEIKTPDTESDPVQENCCGCIPIDPSMYRNKTDNGIYRIDYDPTCSCDWYVYASKKIPVKDLEEYIFHIEARSENIEKRHMKVFFLNDADEIVGTTFIQDVEEKDKHLWNTYEQLLRVPQGAKKLQIQIWARGNKTENGYLELKNYSVLPYRELILLDQITAFEGTDYSAFFPAKAESQNVSFGRTDSMKRTFSVDNPEHDRVLLNFMESPNPLWQLQLQEEQLRGTLTVNGVSTGFIVNGSGPGVIEVVLRKLYYGGLAIFVFSLFFSVWAYRKVDWINRVLKL